MIGPVRADLAQDEQRRAERGGLVVLHYDRDIDRIGDVTHQPMDWIVPAGSADSW